MSDVQRWAMVKDGTVVNVCLWDGQVTTWQPPADVQMHPAPDHVSRDWTLVDGQWVAPVVPEPEPETQL